MFSSVATVKSQARYRLLRLIPESRSLLKIPSNRSRWPLIAASFEGRSSR